MHSLETDDFMANGNSKNRSIFVLKILEKPIHCCILLICLCIAIIEIFSMLLSSLDMESLKNITLKYID